LSKTLLKLAALDAKDLEIVSAHVQDAVMKVGQIAFLPKEGRFVLPMNRLAWETVSGLVRKRAERRRSVLSFDRVVSVRSAGVARDRPAEVLSLLAVRFHADTAAPAGTVELVFSEGAAIRLEVECIEARLADLGGAWQASSLPAHKA
jgi:hypothetical protein